MRALGGLRVLPRDLDVTEVDGRRVPDGTVLQAGAIIYDATLTDPVRFLARDPLGRSHNIAATWAAWCDTWEDKRYAS